MMQFKEYLELISLVELNFEANPVNWKEFPAVGKDARSLFRVGDLGYYMHFFPYDASNLFQNRKSWGYSVKFDAVRDKISGEPLPYDQITTAGNPQVKFFGKAFRRVGGEGATNSRNVIANVVRSMEDFKQKVNPDIISWVPFDNELQKVYNLLSKRFNTDYTLIKNKPIQGKAKIKMLNHLFDPYMLIRKDLMPQLRNKWHPLYPSIGAEYGSDQKPNQFQDTQNSI